MLGAALSSVSSVLSPFDTTVNSKKKNNDFVCCSVTTNGFKLVYFNSERSKSFAWLLFKRFELRNRVTFLCTNKRFFRFSERLVLVLATISTYSIQLVYRKKTDKDTDTPASSPYNR